MNDSISRLAAIKTIDEMLQLLPYDPLKSDYTQGITIGLSLAESRIKRLPPAQPDIIHCKDCKHWMPFDWMFHKVWRSTNMTDYAGYEIGCAYSGMNMGANDFCSRRERREDGQGYVRYWGIYCIC